MKKILKQTTNIIIVALLILTVALFVVKISGSKSGSKMPFHIYEIVTGSMEPTLHASYKNDSGNVVTGDIVFVYKKKIDKLEVGDIISYLTDINSDGTYEVVTHRIIKIDDTGYEIKGDVSGSLDEVLSKGEMEERYLGKVLNNKRLWVLTWLYRILTNIFGFLIIVVLPLIYLIVKEVIELSKAMHKEEDETIEVTNEKGEKVVAQVSKEDKDAVIKEYLEKQAKEEGKGNEEK